MAADTLSTLRTKAKRDPLKFNDREAKLAKVIAEGLEDDLTGADAFDYTTEGTDKIERVAVATYSFAVDGGDTGTTGLGVTLPDNAIVTKVIEEITTDLESASDTGTLKLTLPTDGDLSADVTADGSNAGVASVLPSGTPVKLTDDRELSVTIATEAITAGAARWYIYWVQGA